MPRVGVLGAGIIGLSQACVLQERLPNVEIVLVAEKFSPFTTSDIAAGFWHPYLVGDNPEHVLIRWLRDTFDYILRFANSHPAHGAMLVSGYEFKRKREPTPAFTSIFLNFRELSATEIARTRSPLAYPAEQGWSYTTVFLETSIHLKYLLKKFKENGGKIEQRRVQSLDEMGDFDAIVNCSGIEARSLVNDPAIFPTRGQVIRVRCPAVKHFLLDDETYVLPNSDTTVLGGTAEIDDWDTSVRPQTAKWILEENAKKLPALRDAEIVSHQAGLRPSRSYVRLEAEYFDIRGKKVPVIHNYGHGGSGVTLFYGCALDGADLVASAIKSSKL